MKTVIEAAFGDILTFNGVTLVDIFLTVLWGTTLITR
jgi:hypothetical protein